MCIVHFSLWYFLLFRKMFALFSVRKLEKISFDVLLGFKIFHLVNNNNIITSLLAIIMRQISSCDGNWWCVWTRNWNPWSRPNIHGRVRVTTVCPPGGATYRPPIFPPIFASTPIEYGRMEVRANRAHHSPISDLATTTTAAEPSKIKSIRTKQRKVRKGNNKTKETRNAATNLVEALKRQSIHRHLLRCQVRLHGVATLKTHPTLPPPPPIDSFTNSGFWNSSE